MAAVYWRQISEYANTRRLAKKRVNTQLSEWVSATRGDRRTNKRANRRQVSTDSRATHCPGNRCTSSTTPNWPTGDNSARRRVGEKGHGAGFLLVVINRLDDSRRKWWCLGQPETKKATAPADWPIMCYTYFNLSLRSLAYKYTQCNKYNLDAL